MNGEIPWSLVLPIVVNVGLVAWLFGGLSQRIKILEGEMEAMRAMNIKIDDRVHDIAIVLAKIEVKLEGVFKNPPPTKTARRKKGELCDPSNCQLANA